MPTYEYLCPACSHRFETWQKMIAEPLTICPECGGHIRRVLYPAGIVFKGSGFYKTDHGNSALPPSDGSHGSNGETKHAEEKSGETKPAESKPAENGQKSTTTSESKASTPAATSS